MDSGRSNMRKDVEGDRLSSLPDDLIHKIFSFLDIKNAIETSVLSSRWRFLWTSMPYLNFPREDFSTLPEFSKFVTHVLSRRNNLTDVYSLKLAFHVKARKTSHQFVKRVVNYAFSHNIQQLNVLCLLEDDVEFPLSLFSSQSLKHLSLTMPWSTFGHRFSCCFTSTWELPALTTLDLHDVALCDGECVSVISKCANLKNLTLKRFATLGSRHISISHPRLSSLTLEEIHDIDVLKVSAPQLKNLTIRYASAKLVISAPHLAFFFCKDTYPLRLTTEGFPFLEKADICVTDLDLRDADAHRIVCLLQHLHNVKFLTLNFELVEFLSSSRSSPILHQPSPFVNLEGLVIYPESVPLFLLNQAPVTMSTELKSFLQDCSPGSICTIVLPEEIEAREIMAELRVILNEEARAQLEQGKAQVESQKPGGGNMAQINSCWKNLGVQIGKASDITSKLQDIEQLLTWLPASNRAKIQPCFSSMCAEAEIALSYITDFVKIQCDENQCLTRACFHELATTLQPSS